MEAGHPASNSKEYGSREEVKKYNNMAAGHHGGGGGIKKHDIASFRVDDDLRSDLVQLQYDYINILYVYAQLLYISLH